jgi:hypothetical protein
MCAWAGYSILVMGVPVSTVRPTVHSRSCDFLTTSGKMARAWSPSTPPGNAIRKVTTMPASRLPAASPTLSASARTWKPSGSARREARMSTSIAVHPAIAASSSSVGVKSASLPVPN